MSESRHIIKRRELEDEVVCLSQIEGECCESVPGAEEPDPAVVEEAAGEVEMDQVERVRHLVQAMLSGFSRQRREFIMELQPYVTRISVEVAERIVRRELRTDHGMIARLVGDALKQVAGASRVRVRVHPLDARTLQETLREIVAAPDEADALEIIPDGSIECGGCVVESDRGIVDARLQTQFEEIQTSLLDALDCHDEGLER